MIKKFFKYGLGFALYTTGLIIVEFIIGIGINDPWDKIVKWAQK